MKPYVPKPHLREKEIQQHPRPWTPGSTGNGKERSGQPVGRFNTQ